MTAKITGDILEAYVHCKYKAHLKSQGHRGTKSDYETVHAQVRAEVRDAATKKILARHPDEEIPRHVHLTHSFLKHGASFLLAVTLEIDDVSLHFDGLKRVDGESELGAFHYVPILFYEGRKIRNEQRLLLELHGHILARVQGRQPTYGVVWHGKECKGTKVRLTHDTRKAEQAIRELMSQATGETAPKLLLNDHCQVCEFRQQCHAQAVQEDNLSLLLGMEEKQVAAYNRKGFFTVTQLSHTFRYRKPRKRAKEHTFPHYYSLQARTIRTGVVHVHGTPSFPPATTRVYLDVEGVPDRDFYYLIGVLVETDSAVSYHPFWADSDEGQDSLFRDLADFVATLPVDHQIFHYGKYEVVALKKALAHMPADRREGMESMIGKMVNVLSIVHHHVYFPTYSNTLKEIGGKLGHRWSNSLASGIQSVAWRERWERTQDPAIKEELLTYNREDCTALKAVCDFIAHAVTATPGPCSEGGQAPEVMPTSELPKPPSTWPVYGRPNFVLGDFERASQCAYFDYQRERVYVRTDKRFKQINRRAKPPRLPFTPNKRIVIACEACPMCGSSKIKRRNGLRRKTVDVKFFKGGVKKWIVVYLSWTYQCDGCGARFQPEEWLADRSLYQPGLASWCVYQNVECRQTMWQVKDTLADLFGLHVPQRQLYLFKSWIAKRYESLYEEIRRSILGGHLAHVDEATVDLRNNEKGYVWILASLDKVYYFYKPSREGAFLDEMFDGFNGVLVSDFFSAYESVKCRQQKCLLHFLRDVNEDVQKNPFDEEFKSFAQQFGALLRRIVDTIDRHGLSARFLSRHVPDADQFVETVTTHSYSSEVMHGYQKRIKKSGSRMFTFLRYDNVPWNNNNAEHAVKYLAKYKRVSEGMFSERSLKEALVLLSVFQTCHFNGMNVIPFLLSGNSALTDIIGT
jgi:predicted RecB family nuclease